MNRHLHLADMRRIDIPCYRERVMSGRSRNLVVGLAIGLALGVGVGIAMDKLTLGIAIGVAIGGGLAASGVARHRRDADGGGGDSG